MESLIKKYIAEPLRESIVLLIMKVFLIMFLFSTAFFAVELFVLRLDLPTDYHIYVTVFLFVGHIFKSLLEVYFVLNILMRWLGNVYYFDVEERRLIKREGILTVREKIYDLKIIRSIAIQQSLFGRLLRYGNITITTSASGGYNDQIYLNGIPDPGKSKEMFQQCLTIRPN